MTWRGELSAKEGNAKAQQRQGKCHKQTPQSPSLAEHKIDKARFNAKSNRFHWIIRHFCVTRINISSASHFTMTMTGRRSEGRRAPNGFAGEVKLNPWGAKRAALLNYQRGNPAPINARRESNELATPCETWIGWRGSCGLFSHTRRTEVGINSLLIYERNTKKHTKGFRLIKLCIKAQFETIKPLIFASLTPSGALAVSANKNKKLSRDEEERRKKVREKAKRCKRELWRSTWLFLKGLKPISSLAFLAFLRFSAPFFVPASWFMKPIKMNESGGRK